MAFSPPPQTLPPDYDFISLNGETLLVEDDPNDQDKWVFDPGAEPGHRFHHRNGPRGLGCAHSAQPHRRRSAWLPSLSVHACRLSRAAAAVLC